MRPQACVVVPLSFQDAKSSTAIVHTFPGQRGYQKEIYFLSVDVALVLLLNLVKKQLQNTGKSF
jgi:hypothetical protein